MNFIKPPASPVTGPAAWTGADMQDRPDQWCYELGGSEIAELERAAEQTLGTDVQAMTREQFELPTFATTLAGFAEQLDRGIGFSLVRGLPVQRYTEEEATRIYWGMGLHLGIPVPQNGAGALLTSVRDISADPAAKDTRNAPRGYNSSAGLHYHTDSSDVVGLLCLHPSKWGGISTIASSAAVHNEMLRTRPDLLELLYQPFAHGHKGEQAAGEPPMHYTPIFSHHQGQLSCRFVHTSIRDTYELFPELGELPDEVFEAWRMMDDLAGELHLNMDFQHGDMQFLNNYAILHSRTAYEDYPELERRRHLLRLWLTLHEGRELAINFGRSPGIRDAYGGRGGMQNRRTVTPPAA